MMMMMSPLHENYDEETDQEILDIAPVRSRSDTCKSYPAVFIDPYGIVETLRYSY